MHKLIKKYWVGGELTSPTYTPTYNLGTDLYNEMKNRQFGSIGNLFSNEILKNALENGLFKLLNLVNTDLFKQKVEYNTKTLDTLNSLSGVTSSVIGASKNFTKGKGLFSKENIGGTAQVVGAVADGLRTFTPENKAYSGKKGNWTKTFDAGYNMIGDVAMGVNPVVGMAFKLGGLASDGINAITGGTDGMTTKDAIFSSTIGNLTGIGIINSAFGKNADTFYKDNKVWASQGGAYGGSMAKVDAAMETSGKRFGLTSRKEMREANRKGAIAMNELGTIRDIDNVALDAFLRANNSQTISLKNLNDLNGMNWGTTRKGKSGLKLDRDFALRVVKLSKGDKSKIRSIGELIKYAKLQNPRFIQRLSEPPRGIKFIDDDGNEVEGSHYLESAGEYVIPRILEVDGNLKFFNHLDAVNRAIETGNYLKMTPEEAIIFAKEYKQGWPEFFKKFKNGGTVNVIPDGALHKNKHHLENVDEKFEDVTAKGIPVITESAGGDITQHAEVEREEIIFNLNVTKQLEKLMEDGSDEAAIEAGKLLVHEILENTVDNTGLLNKIE